MSTLVGTHRSRAGFFMYSHCKLYAASPAATNSSAQNKQGSSSVSSSNLPSSSSGALLSGNATPSILPIIRAGPRRDVESMISLSNADGSNTPPSLFATTSFPTASGPLARSLTPTKRQMLESMAVSNADVAIAIPSEGSDPFGAVRRSAV